MSNIEQLKQRKATRQSELDTAVAAFNAKNQEITRAQTEQQESVGQINVLVGKVQELADQIAEAEAAETKSLESHPLESATQDSLLSPVTP